MPESAGFQLQFAVTREDHDGEGRITSAHIDREIDWKCVPRVLLYLLLFSKVGCSRTLQEHSRGGSDRGDGCDQEVLLFSMRNLAASRRNI